MKYLYGNEHWELNKEYNIDKILYSMIDRPNYINKYNDFAWGNNKGYIHRNYDLPSYINNIDNNGIPILFWYKNGGKHRKGSKPAFIGCNGDKEYYINNKFITVNNNRNVIELLWFMFKNLKFTL